MESASEMESGREREMLRYGGRCGWRVKGREREGERERERERRRETSTFVPLLSDRVVSLRFFALLLDHGQN